MEIMNQDFSMKAYLDKLVQTCFYSTDQVRGILRYLKLEAAKTIVCIHWRADYCNRLFAGLAALHSLHRLQVVLNVVTRLVCGLQKFDRITRALRNHLH